MNAPTGLLILIAPAYVAGSIPFGLLVGWSKGIDVRKAGSGNIGATNVGRVLGKRFFWIVFFLDLLKGLLPSLGAGLVIRFSASDWLTYLLWLAVGFAAILGHMFSVFLKFKGGKGVSTSTGAMLGIWPYFTLPTFGALVVFVTVYKLAGYISAASIIAAIAFPIIYALIGLNRGWPIWSDQLPFLAAATILAAMIVFRHRGNIARLLAGTEHKAGSAR